jgi:hypothetical protein
MRYPSKSGIELWGKSISAVYLTDGNQTGDAFNASMASGFAAALEKDYGTGEGSVGVYSLEDKGGVYSQKDTLINLLMDTDCDAVFLFDRVGMQNVGENTIKFNIKLYCFDAMNKDFLKLSKEKGDSLRFFIGLLSSSDEDTVDRIAKKIGRNTSTLDANTVFIYYSLAHEDAMPKVLFGEDFLRNK